jgi:RNA-dependent RNA polymerase
MDLVTSRLLREFKYSARIPLPGCYNLVGVPDQDDLLEPDEIYCAIREPDGAVKYLEGHIAITRLPNLDAGDVRVVRAVGRLPNRFPAIKIISLVNFVVLSTKGDRAIASMMGGGDLDGDQYNVGPLSS